MHLRRTALLGVIVGCVGTATWPARAASPDQQIRARLTTWMQDFNAGRRDRVCDLFSRSLIAQFRGTPERGYAAQCQLLQSSLAPGARQFHYDLAIKDVIVSGSLAAVRLTWTLTVRTDGQASPPSDEIGMDIFRRESDGQWRIIRYIAFATD